MKNPITVIVALVVVIIIAIAGASAYTINERQQVVITQFGEPIGEAVTEPGLHFKIPFVQNANKFEKRFLEWDGDRDQIPTRDGRFIWVDTYARWRISDPLLFLQRLNSEAEAQSRLDDILDSETKSAIARHNLVELIRSTNREVAATEFSSGEIGAGELQQIQFGRARIVEEITAAVAPKTLQMGIELLDLQFKRIKFKEDVEKSIFDRMISERNRVAERFRSEGQGDASRILGDKERDLLEIQSEAYKLAEEIKGTADGEATLIYASAYNKNDETREFYRFLKTMETYQNTLTENDWLILSTKSDFFKYLRNQNGR